MKKINLGDLEFETYEARPEGYKASEHHGDHVMVRRESYVDYYDGET